MTINVRTSSNPRITRVVVVLTLALMSMVLAGCSPKPEGLAVVANGQASLGVGEQRMVIAHRADDGSDLSSPDSAVTLELTSPSGETFTYTPRFIWMLEGVRGLYVADVAFGEAGIWNAVLLPEGGPPTNDSPFFVEEDSIVPDVGEPAVASVTATLDDAVAEDLSDITTDPSPDPRLYAGSLDVRLTNGQPTVLVFATPAFCQTATCGPMLDQVKAAKSEFGDGGINWVHVEVYTNLDDPSNLELVQAVLDWRLPSEPWTFVIDSEGTIAARFEGAMGDDELRDAIASVLP